MSDKWDSESLYLALQNAEVGAAGSIGVELMQGAEDAIVASMADFGDLPIVLSVGSEQILAQVLLWPVADVKDPARFNAVLLQTHKLMPLSTFGITKGPDGADYYELFGALSVSSKLENVLLELEMLATNAIEAVDVYAEDRR